MRKELYSKRNIVIFIMIVVLIPINLCCIIFSNIPYSTEIKNLKNFEDLKWFETITFALNSYLISAVYTLLIYGIPIEIYVYSTIPLKAGLDHNPNNIEYIY